MEIFTGHCNCHRKSHCGELAKPLVSQHKAELSNCIMVQHLSILTAYLTICLKKKDKHLDRQRDRQTETERERQTDGERISISICKIFETYRDKQKDRDRYTETY